MEIFIRQLLSMCGVAKLKRVEINRLSDEVYKKIHAMFPQVKFVSREAAV